MDNTISLLITLFDGVTIRRIAVKTEFTFKVQDALDYYLEPDNQEFLRTLLPINWQSEKIVKVEQIDGVWVNG